MATSEGDPVAPVLAALASMRGNVDRTQKSQAHEYLEKFQKSVSTNIRPLQHRVTHTQLARSLDDHTYNPSITRYTDRSQALRSDYTKRKGIQSGLTASTDIVTNVARSLTTLTKYLVNLFQLYGTRSCPS